MREGGKHRVLLDNGVMEQWSNVARLNEKATLNALVKLRLNPSMRRQDRHKVHCRDHSCKLIKKCDQDKPTEKQSVGANGAGNSSARMTLDPPISSGCKVQLFKHHTLANSSINEAIQR